MADFSVASTQLQAPQGAGTKALSPVQGPGDYVPDLSGLGSLFTTAVGGGGGSKKAPSLTKDISSQYSERYADLQQMLSNGSITDAQFRVRDQQLANHFTGLLAQKGLTEEGVPELKKIRDGLDSLTTTDDDFTKRTAGVLDARNSLLKKGVEMGVVNPDVFGQYDAKTQQQVLSEVSAMLNTQRLTEQSKAEVEATRATFRFGVEQGNAAYAEKQRRLDQNSRQLMAQMGELGYRSVEQFGMQVQQAVTEGRHGDIATMGAQFLSTWRSRMLRDSNGDQQLAAQFDTTFRPLVDAYVKAANPATAADINKAIIDKAKTDVQIKMLMDPKVRAYVSASAMVGGVTSQFMANQAGTILMDSVSQYTKALEGQIPATERNTPAPSIVAGDTDAQKAVFMSLKGMVGSIGTGPVDATIGKTVDSVLKGVARLDTVRPGNLSPMLDMFSGPEMGKIVAEGLVKPELGVQAAQSLTEAYTNAFSSIRDQWSDAPIDPKVPALKVQDLVNFRWEGDKVRRVSALSLDTIRNYRRQSRGDMNDPLIGTDVIGTNAARINSQYHDYAESMTKFVKSMAHLAGRTDYEQVWNEQRAALLPNFYPAEGTDDYKQAIAEGWDGKGSVMSPLSYRSTPNAKP